MMTTMLMTALSGLRLHREADTLKADDISRLKPPTRQPSSDIV